MQFATIGKRRGAKQRAYVCNWRKSARGRCIVVTAASGQFAVEDYKPQG
jgi:hypothetical protein